MIGAPHDLQLENKRCRIVPFAATMIVGLFFVGCVPTERADSQQLSSETATESTAPTKPATAHEDLDATLWIQTSAEYAANTRMAYRAATDALRRAQQDFRWSALPSQQQLIDTAPVDADPLPPAVILDVDETVLDNTAYQAALIEQRGEYRRETWQEFVSLAASHAVPGVKEFLEVCREHEITIFFVTNRDVSVEKHTRRNLEQLGLIPSDASDSILSKNERDEWTTDKASRREFVATRHRILLMIGDDLNDFVWAGVKPTSAARRELTSKYASYWGSKWFMLPNPNYGGWERSIYGFEDALPWSEKIQQKRSALRAP